MQIASRAPEWLLRTTGRRTWWSTSTDVPSALLRKDIGPAKGGVGRVGSRASSGATHSRVEADVSGWATALWREHQGSRHHDRHGS